MRPGVDQLPGSNMEYYIADEGLLYQEGNKGILINAFDTPLLYMGEMESHPIVLCNNKEENNHRPVYSWIMNNTWETNFKMDLSGFGEFSYAGAAGGRFGGEPAQAGGKRHGRGELYHGLRTRAKSGGQRSSDMGAFFGEPDREG